MGQNRLNEYGFQLLDTRTASDHFPKVTDFSFDIIANVSEVTKPNNFILKQNYPNPFNPKTNIGFRISEHGFVSLKIYDVLGNEVATLVNEQLAPGEYEIEFSRNLINRDFTGEFTSGVYFYQMSVQPSTISGRQYMETKKMLLLK
jgi:hypothetical protein